MDSWKRGMLIVQHIQSCLDGLWYTIMGEGGWLGILINSYKSIVVVICQYTSSMESQTYISCISWIQRGFAAKVPKEIELTQEEINEMKQDPMVAQGLHQHGHEYDQEMEQEEDDMPVFGDNLMEMMNSGAGNYPMAIEDLSDDEKEDYYIKDTDALIVAGKIEKQYSSLEVYIYEQDRNNLFVHHEIMLSAFPLDIQWLKVNLGSINRNYAIVSSFLPQIEIWNLDLTEAIQPDVILGGQIQQTSKKPKKFTNKAKKFRAGSHTDSVTSLSLNKSNLSVLASGSIDTTVKIWDISKQACVHTSSHHKAGVKKVEWSSIDVSVLFTASADNTISILDSRFPNDQILHSAPEGQEIESACWNVNNQSQIAYVTSTGNLNLFDVRKSNQLVASQKAHNSKANDVRIGKKNLCFTCSQDETVRVWNLNNLSEPLASKNPKCGILMCLDLLEDDAGPILSAGNTHGELFVWDVTENERINAYWSTTH